SGAAPRAREGKSAAWTPGGAAVRAAHRARRDRSDRDRVRLARARSRRRSLPTRTEEARADPARLGHRPRRRGGRRRSPALDRRRPRRRTLLGRARELAPLQSSRGGPHGAVDVRIRPRRRAALEEEKEQGVALEEAPPLRPRRA